MTEENLPPSKDSTGDRLLSGFFNLVRIFIRFVIIALLVAVLALLVLGIPFAYWRFVTPAVNEFQQMATSQVEEQQVNQRLLVELENIQQRLDTLETRLDSEKQQVGEISQAVDGLASAQRQDMELYTQTQSAVEERVQEILSEITSLDNRTADLSAALEIHQERIDAVEENSKDLEARLLSEDEPINRLYRDIQVIRIMELLTRSRLYIYQDNFGLAQDDLEAANEILSGLEIPESQAESAAEIIEKINLAIKNLPSSPELSAGELEIAWQLLNSRLFSGTGVNAVATGSPAVSTVSITETPEGAGTITATPAP